jgi:predicted nucleotidyltransferase
MHTKLTQIKKVLEIGVGIVLVIFAGAFLYYHQYVLSFITLILLLAKKIYQSKLEQNKRIEEEKTLEELVKSQFPFVLRGSWAGEIISGIQSNHKDIDIYVLEKDWEKFKNFLEGKGFKIEKIEKSKYGAKRDMVFIDCHLWKEEENYYVEESIHGTFYFPKEYFDQHLYKNLSITIMSPELMWILKQGYLTADSKRNLKKLEKFIDKKKVQEISNKFKYIPPDKS